MPGRSWALIADTTGTHGFLLKEGAFTAVASRGGLGTQACDINRTGEIVGTYSDASGFLNGFLLSDGRYTRIRYPGAWETSAIGINDAGEITGCYMDAGGRQHGFVGVPRKKVP